MRWYTLWCAASAVFVPEVAMAQSATWTGALSGDWQTSVNWSPAAQPSATAIFGNSSQTTLTFSNNDFFHPQSVGTIQLNADAPTYTFKPSYLSFTGAGIVNNSASSPILAPFAALSFLNNSSAANAHISTATSGSTFGYAEFRNAQHR